MLSCIIKRQLINKACKYDPLCYSIENIVEEINIVYNAIKDNTAFFEAFTELYNIQVSTYVKLESEVIYKH